MRTYLFVCTGNTCRSAMAEGIFNYLAKQKGLSLAVRAISAGLSAVNGVKASKGAIDSCKRHNIDISLHKTRFLTNTLAKSVDLIITMTGQQLFDIIMSNPESSGKVYTLCQWGFDDDSLDMDIKDPFGSNQLEYDHVFDDLFYFIGSALDRLTKDSNFA